MGVGVRWLSTRYGGNKASAGLCTPPSAKVGMNGARRYGAKLKETKRDHDLNLTPMSYKKNCRSMGSTRGIERMTRDDRK